MVVKLIPVGVVCLTVKDIYSAKENFWIMVGAKPRK